jgi:FHS family L-fucose permease-like MFS transporter
MPKPLEKALTSLSMIVLFFESCIFPTIFTLSLRGLGRHTKRGASYLVASVSGGAVIPAILGNVADKTGTRKAMVVPLSFFLIAWSFPIYLNMYKGKELDAYRESAVGYEDADGANVTSNTSSTYIPKGDMEKTVVERIPTQSSV